LGGRSRNGWGSVSIELQGETRIPSIDINGFTSSLEDALEKDWPHAIGRDDQKPLIWRTKPFADWSKAMTELASLRKKLNARFKSDRRLLNYPVTELKVHGWENKRLPNSLRFKVVPAADGHVKGLAFHLPCLPPKEFGPKKDTVTEVWRKVHAFLDRPSESGLERVQS